MRTKEKGGADRVKKLYGVLGGLVRLAKLSPADIRIDSLEFNETYTKASLQTSHRVKGEWKSQKPGTWILEGKQWVVKL